MSECTRNTLAAHKRLNKEFFPVDPFEDPPSPETVAIVVKCWHIMPLVRDEDEGEMWWILGPNNKTPQEASTAGPFKTKKEAFWTALEHNRTLGVNAVYVHGKNENGERSDGDFEEPSEEDFADTTADGGCPYCGQNLTNTAVCKHFVGSLGDDDAGGDTVTPLYFGWTEHHDESHDNMIECLDGYFEALCGLCDQIVKAGADEAKRMRSEAKRLPPAERAILTQAVQLLDHLGSSEDYETPQELLRGELPSQLKTFFTELFRQARGKPMATDWIIRGACCGPAHIIGRKMPGNVSGASFKKAGRQLTAYRSLSKRASVR